MISFASVPPEILTMPTYTPKSIIQDSPCSLILFNFLIFAHLIGKKKHLRGGNFGIFSRWRDILISLKVMWISERKLLGSQEKRVWRG